MKFDNVLCNSSPKKRLQNGATLIEVLVTMFLVAVGLLGTVGLQIAATRYQQTSFMRSQALTEAQGITEKIRANQFALTAASPAAPANQYLATTTYASSGVLPDDPECGLTGQTACTSQQAAQRDIREWRQSLLQKLPGGRGSILPVGSGGAIDPLTRQIVVMWREKQQNTTNQDETDLPDPSCPTAVSAAVGIRCFTLVVTP